MKRLVIDNVVADLPNTPIGFNWEYLDLSDPGKRYAPFSSSIKLPFSPANNKIMSFGNAIGGRLIQVRNLPNVDFWLGHNKVIEGGYLKVNSIDKSGFNCNISGSSGIVNTLNNYDIDDAIDTVAALFTYSSPNYGVAIESLAAGLEGSVNYGFLLPRTLADPITSTTWTIYDTSELYKHEIWCSAAAIMKGLIDNSVCTFKVWEGQALVDIASSYIYSDLQKLYTPAWNYTFKFDNTWKITKETSGQRIINSKSINRTELKTIAGKTTWEYLKVVAQLFCCSIYTSGTQVVFVPLNEITSGTTDFDLSGRMKSHVKHPNIPGQNYINYIKFKNTDNLPAYYGRMEVLAPVNPYSAKDLFAFDAMMPGLYYNSYVGNIFNTDVNANGELNKSILLLYDDGTTTETTVVFEASPSNFSEVADLKVLSRFEFDIYYTSFQALSAKGLAFDVEMSINPFDLIRLKPYSLLKIHELGGLFYLNKISNYDPDSGKLAKCQVVKFDTPSFSVSPLTLSYASGVETKTVTVTSAVFWQITAYPAWIIPSATLGYGSDTFTLRSTINTGVQRTGTVKVARRGYSDNQEISITVTQAAP